MESKKIVSYCSKESYCILIPVYYEFEEKHERKKEIDSRKEECEKVFSNYPDSLNASNEENIQNRKNKIQEYLFLLSIGKNEKAEKIKMQYNF